MLELTKELSTLTVLADALLTVFLAACGGEPTGTPSPTGSPTPRLITANPEDDPAGFLSALPETERKCLEQAVGPENLEALIRENNPDVTILEACLGEETVRAVVLGQSARQAGGLGDGTVDCLFHETNSIDFRRMSFGDGIGPGHGTYAQATVLCLSDEELIRLYGAGLGDETLNVERIHCLMLSDMGGVATNGQPNPEIVALLDKCGTASDLIKERPPLTAEQEACLIDAIGETATQEVYGLVRSPTPEEIEAFSVCYDGAPDSVRSLPEMDFPDFESLPEIGAPLEISSVAWPSSAQDAWELLERLPDEISGHKLTERDGGPGADRSIVSYRKIPEIQEPALMAQVMDLTQGNFSPAGTTAGDFVALFAQGFDREVLAAGREGSFGWVHIKTTGTSSSVAQDFYSVIWGNAPSSVVFNAQVNDPMELAALVQAMVAAAR